MRWVYVNEETIYTREVICSEKIEIISVIERNCYKVYWLKVTTNKKAKSDAKDIGRLNKATHSWCVKQN